MTTFGIDTLAMDTSRYAMTLDVLAKARQTDPEKYRVGLGQEVMSVSPPGEDIVTMAANAAHQALRDVDKKHIAMLLFATESGLDQSKAAGIYVHRLLGLAKNCRIVEVKQACYGGTAALQLALPFLYQYPDKKVLVIASDIVHYGFGSSGESSQGSGAVAMILSANPRVMTIEPEYGVVADDVMDFWRPHYLHEALVDGKYSSKLYLQMLQESFQAYQLASGRGYADHAYYCYHVPVPRLVEKAHRHLLKCLGQEASVPLIEAQVQDSLLYGRQIGNSCSASLYVALASLLDNVQENLSEKRIGFYSYGSGCVAEYFSGVVQKGYRAALHTDYHRELLASRILLSYDEYAAFYQFKYVEDGSEQIIPHYATGMYRMARLENHKRIYASMLESNTRNLDKEMNAIAQGQS